MVQTSMNVSAVGGHSVAAPFKARRAQWDPSARSALECVIVFCMRMRIPFSVDKELHDALQDRANQLCVPMAAVIRHAAIRELESPPDPIAPAAGKLTEPVHLSPAVRRVWLELAARSADGQIVPTSELATAMCRHRGNIDRALAMLREEGYAVRVTKAGHIATNPKHIRTDAAEAPLAS